MTSVLRSVGALSALSLSSNLEGLRNSERSVPSQALFVRKAEPHEYPELIKIARVWNQVSEQSCPKNISFDYCDPSCQMVQLTQSLIRSMSKEQSEPTEIYIAHTSDDEVEGMMQVLEEYKARRVKILVTNAKNLAPNSPNKTSLVGSSLLEEVEKIVQREGGKEVVLEPSCNALSFYLQKGYLAKDAYDYSKEVPPTDLKKSSVDT